MKKSMKKLVCGVLAGVSALGCAATMTACTTDNPVVQMKIEFNDETYTLNYKLYRKVAPQTVKHFLYLAENGYYDGLCVHDYDNTSIHTGAYTVGASATTLEYKPYFETVKEFGDKFPHSVWTDAAKENSTYTLKGEFEQNEFRVKSGAKDETYGSLTMFYFDEPDGADVDVYAVRASEKDKVDSRGYEYNLTTSMFYISLTSTDKVNDEYCTFATLDSGDKKTLQKLVSAIEKYAGEDDFTEEVTMEVFEDDVFLRDYSKKETFDVPTKPIVIKSVKVKKY